MSTTLVWFVPAILLMGLGLSLDQAGNLTGTWQLNVEKSHWGEMRRPTSVVIVIDHNEPTLHYSGSIVYANEDTRDFAFDGAIDGKAYPMTRSFGKGKAVLRRVGPARNSIRRSRPMTGCMWKVRLRHCRETGGRLPRAEAADPGRHEELDGDLRTPLSDVLVHGFVIPAFEAP